MELDAATIKIPDNVPVSFLEKLVNFSDDVLMLASEPNSQTETQYMSKYFTYGDLSSQLYDNFQIGEFWAQINNINITKVDLSSLLDNTLKCDVATPYIISAISQRGGNIVSLEGYRLQDGMHTVFNQSSVKKDLKSVIPSLTATTISADSGYVLTSVTTENGQAVSVGGVSIASIAPTIENATVSANQNCFISSVTTEGGKVTGVGSVPFSAIVGNGVSTAYIRHIENADALDPNFTADDRVNLKILRCTETQLDALKRQNLIERNVIYMTT